jgi:allantoin racemase
VRLLVINPNTTAAMTDSIAAAARQVARPGTEIVARNPATGPPAIQGADDGAAALPGLIALFETEVVTNGGYDAAVIACFDDTGLDALKAWSSVPVLGIGEAAFHAAMLLGRWFSVVTTLAVSVPVIEANIARYGYGARCAKVRASGVPVLDLEHAKDASETAIAAEIAQAVADDGCDCVVLGCAGMADLAERMSRRFGLPVIDGVAAAVAFAEALHDIGAQPGRPARAPIGAEAS